MSFEEQAKRAHGVEDKVAKSLLSMKPDYVRVEHDDRKQKGFEKEIFKPICGTLSNFRPMARSGNFLPKASPCSVSAPIISARDTSRC